MNSEKIQNTKVEVPKGKNLNCKIIYKNIFDTLIEMQRETFNIMFRNGWYKLETAPTNKINEKYNELNQELIDLNG